jgi:hypothetical protein
MRKTMVVIVLLLGLIVTGCESDQLLSENKVLTLRLDEANKQLQGYAKDKEALNQTIVELDNMRKQLEKTATAQKQSEDDLGRYKNWITDIMNIKDFQFEIISEAITRTPYDKVVYIQNVSDENKEQLLYLLKAALTFSNDKADRVTFWRDREQATLYRDGNYDPDGGPAGWSGFDYRFGSIINNGPYTKLVQHNSRDDSQLIDFGKYTSQEN